MSHYELENQILPLFLAALDGDAVAYRAFLASVSLRLRVYLAHMLARAGRTEASETEDVLQDTLLALHLTRHTYDRSSPVTAWVYAIARYKLVDHLRRSGRHIRNMPLDDEAFQLSVPAGNASTEARLDLERALDVLPDRTRDLIQSVKLQGASIAEAARGAGMSETAAKVAIHRGLQVMAKFLARSGARLT